MFADCCYLELTHLVAPKHFYDENDLIDILEDQEGVPQPCLEPTDIHALSSCCPALQRLDAGRVLHIQPALTSLQHLTHLQARWPYDKPAVALAALTHLRHLELSTVFWLRPETPLAVSELVSHLSQLVQLTFLQADPGGKQCLGIAAAGMLACMPSLGEIHFESITVTLEEVLQLGASHKLRVLRCSIVTDTSLLGQMMDVRFVSPPESITKPWSPNGCYHVCIKVGPLSLAHTSRPSGASSSAGMV